MALLRRIANLFRRSRLDHEISEELRAHIEMRIEDNMAAGMTPEDARREAMLRFGNTTAARERVAAQDANLHIESLVRDVRYAARQMRRNPGFTLTVVIILGLGIGANAAVFDVLSAMLLRPIPFPSGNRIVRVTSMKGGMETGASPLDVRDFAAQSKSFSYLAVFDQWRKNVTTTRPGDAPEQEVVGLAPAALFQSLEVVPVAGRLFTQEEGLPGRNHVALLSESFAKTHYPQGPAVPGQKIIINGIAYDIIGVLPDTIPGWMNGASRPLDIWEPFLPEPGIWDEASRGGRGYGAVGLLKPGVTIEQAQADLRTIAASLARAYPVDRGYDVRIEPLVNARAGNMKPIILLLFGAVLLILLIACSNLAGLLLARNSARAREFAMRTALGAPRAALIRQMLVEVALLCALGGAAGIGAARLAEAGLAQKYAVIAQFANLRPDWRVVAFTLGLTALTCAGFGLAPALLSSRTNPLDAMKEGGRSAGVSKGHWLRGAVVVAQIALSLMLVTASGLLVQSLLRLENRELGFRAGDLFKAHFYLPPARYNAPEEITRFCESLRERVAASPGATDVSVTTTYPPFGRWRMRFSVEGRPVSRLEDLPEARFGVSDTHYLQTMAIPLLRGRNFAETDTARAEPVAIVNEAFAERFLGGDDPVGLHVSLGTPPNLGVPDEWLGNRPVKATVVGVMGDAPNVGLAFPAAPQVMMLYRQMPWVNFGFKDIVVRSPLAPELVEKSVRTQLQLLDNSLPLSEASSMTAYLANQSWDRRFTAMLLGAFAALGVTLAMIGLYGIMSYLVIQRAQEIGIRRALGASRKRVVGMVAWQGARLAGMGAALGLAGTVLARGSIAGMLYGVQALDPATLICAALGLIAVAVLAAAIPALRAARVNPADVLHCA
jgi:predicted permease